MHSAAQVAKVLAPECPGVIKRRPAMVLPPGVRGASR